MFGHPSGLGSTKGSEALGPSRRVSTVLFDLDETLFDHSYSLARGISTLRQEQPRLLAVPVRGLIREYTSLLDRIQPGAPDMPRTHPEARLERFRRLDLSRGGAGESEVARRWSETYRGAYQASRRAVPGAAALLERLSGNVSIGVVSNNHTNEQVDKLQVLGLAPWVDFLVTSEDEGIAKPDPRIFHAALGRARCDPRSAVMVGDTWATDILGAARAGIPALWLQRRRNRLGGLTDVPTVSSFTPTSVVADLILSGTLTPPGGRQP